MMDIDIYNMWMYIYNSMVVRSVFSSGLRYGVPRFESNNGKRLRLNPTTPALDLLVPSWGWDNSYGSPVPSGPRVLLWLRPGKKATLVTSPTLFLLKKKKNPSDVWYKTIFIQHCHLAPQNFREMGSKIPTFYSLAKTQLYQTSYFISLFHFQYIFIILYLFFLFFS